MSNSSISDLVGNCIAPFLDASKFSTDGGFIDGRFCAPIESLPGHPTCCLPCPVTDWVYSNKFRTFGVVSEWLNVLGLVLMVFMLVSYLVLPTTQTRSHYLSVCLVVSIGMIALGFTIPLGAKPDECYDAITPNDMYSLTECAWSGAFIIAGGLATDVWIFIRALSMNLQICWDIVPGKRFFYISQLLGWGIPAIIFTITMTLTGVSFRFGTACHVNHKDSMGDFWGPLLAFAGASGIIQLVTFGYCIHVYLKNLWTDAGETSTNASSNGLPSYQASVRTQTARAVYRRLKKVLWLQWRGICIVSIILIDVVFFSIVFVSLDGMQQSVARDWTKVTPWLLCLVRNPGDKDACLPLVHGWLVNEPTVVAVLLLLSLAGLQVFLLLTRLSVFPAWIDFIRSKVFKQTPKQPDFVSLEVGSTNVMRNSNHSFPNNLATKQDFYTSPNQPPAFDKTPIQTSTAVELKAFASPPTTVSSPETAHVASPPPSGRFPPEYVRTHVSPSPAASPPNTDDDYFQALPSVHVRSYRPPVSSFSAPRNSSIGGNFDPREARGGLGLNPPSEASESVEDLHNAWRTGKTSEWDPKNRI